MSYKVEMTDNRTGQTKIIDMGPDLPWGDHSVYWWTDGNYGCDCNRHILFHGTQEDADCTEGNYTVHFAILEDGTRIAIDGDDHGA